ncbi:hypothetical protein FRB90_007832 [Tulasnella sp. 427]|nr:hypothetical protein FRB90_007832 [Tulasnella sp. 427]
MEENDDEATLNVINSEADEEGWLCDLPLEVESGNEGRSKVPYRLKLGDELYIAKEVVHLGGKGKVTPNEAQEAVLHELKRLEQARWALNQFKTLAREKAIPLEPVDITPAFLVTLCAESKLRR